MSDNEELSRGAPEETAEQLAARLSALDENIAKKGKNSYYYAHSLKANGPAWDGKEEPRLLSVTPVAATPGEAKERRVRKEFESYSWMDGKKAVKIFVDHPDPSSVDDDRIAIHWTTNSIEFVIREGDVDRCLAVGALHDNITGASHKRKSDAFVISLNKAVEASWYQLKKTSS